MENSYEFKSLEMLERFFQDNDILNYRQGSDFDQQTISLSIEDFFDFFAKKVESPIFYFPLVDSIERYCIDKKSYRNIKAYLMEEYPQYKEIVQAENFYQFFSEIMEEYNHEQIEKILSEKNEQKFRTEYIISYLYFLYQGTWFETIVFFENYEVIYTIDIISGLFLNNIEKFSNYDAKIRKENTEKNEKLKKLLKNDIKFKSSTNQTRRKEYYNEQKEKRTEIFELLDTLYREYALGKLHNFYQEFFKNK